MKGEACSHGEIFDIDRTSYGPFRSAGEKVLALVFVNVQCMFPGLSFQHHNIAVSVRTAGTELVKRYRDIV